MRQAKGDMGTNRGGIAQSRALHQVQRNVDGSASGFRCAHGVCSLGAQSVEDQCGQERGRGAGLETVTVEFDRIEEAVDHEFGHLGDHAQVHIVAKLTRRPGLLESPQDAVEEPASTGAQSLPEMRMITLEIAKIGARRPSEDTRKTAAITARTFVSGEVSRTSTGATAAI